MQRPRQKIGWLRKTFYIAALGIAALVGAAWFMLDRATDGLCDNEILRALQSPDGRYTAYIFYRDCGATTRTSTQIAVVRGKELLANDPGNVFRAEPSRENPQEPVIGARWLDSRNLEIRYLAASRIFARESQFRDVQIRYVVE